MTQERRARIGARAGWLLFAFYLGLLAASGLFRPLHEWDLVAYVACAMERSGVGAAELHAAAFGALEAELEGPELGALTTGSAYRERMAQDPEAFAAQLPFYRGRVLYVELVRALHLLGLRWVAAVHALSVLATLLLGLVAWRWASRAASGLPGAIACVLVLSSSGAASGVESATPDALAAMLVVLGAYLLLERGRALAASCAFGLAILARDDSLLPAAFLLGAAPLPQLRPTARLAAIGSLCALVLGLRLYFDSHGWSAVVRHSFLGYLDDPSAAPPLSIGEHLRLLSARLPELHSLRGALLGTYLGLILWLGRGARILVLPALALLAALLLRVALFPALWDRFLVATCVILGLLAFRAVLVVSRGQHPFGTSACV